MSHTEQRRAQEPHRGVDRRKQPFAYPVLISLERWHPISSAPKDGTRIISLNINTSVEDDISATYWKGERWFGWPFDNQPTHWIPVPAMPSMGPS